MNPIIRSPSEFEKSTTDTDLEKYNKIMPKGAATTEKTSVVDLAPAGIGHKVSSKTGKKPRTVQQAEKESASARFRSNMQEARVSLAREMYSGEPHSLSQLRLSRGLSQTQLAKAIGTSQSHIAKMEAGAVNLYWDTVKRLADALGVSLDYLRLILDATASRGNNV